MVQQNTASDTVEPRNVGEILGDPQPGYMFKKAIEAVKDAVPIEQVAAEYGEFKLQGAGRLLGHCVAPDHKDKTPSLTIFTDSQRFKCFGCQLHGDVVDLERVAGRHAEAWTAVIALAERYGVELPRRSETWHRWHREKLAVEDLAEDIRFQVRCRRLFKVLILSSPEIQGIENPVERRAEIALCWREFQAGMRKVGR